ncbi:MAG: hypothetical protein ABR582_15595 [Gemmatimonadaceae bacterium]
MTRIRIILGLSLTLTGCTQASKEEAKKAPPAFSDNGAAASQRISRSLLEPAVAAKLRNCLSQLKGEGLVATNLTYRKSGNSWTFDNLKVTKASLAQGQDPAIQKCMEESARGTSFTVDSNQELETASTEFVVHLGWTLPLPPEGTEVTNDAIARMIGTGGVITMAGCSTCELKKDGTGNYQCVRKTSGNEGDCEIISSNSCATSTKACLSGVFGGSRGMVMF